MRGDTTSRHQQVGKLHCALQFNLTLTKVHREWSKNIFPIRKACRATLCSSFHVTMRSTSDKSATATTSTLTSLAAARLEGAPITSSVIFFFRAACSRCFWLLSQVKWHWSVTQYDDAWKDQSGSRIARLLSVTNTLKIWIFFMGFLLRDHRGKVLKILFYF